MKIVFYYIISLWIFSYCSNSVYSQTFDENKADSLWQLGKKEYNLENFSGAIEKFTDAINFNSRDSKIYFWRAHSYFKMDSLEFSDEAVLDYSNAINIDSLGQYFLDRAATYHSMFFNDTNSNFCLMSIDDYKRAINKNVDNLYETDDVKKNIKFLEDKCSKQIDISSHVVIKQKYNSEKLSSYELVKGKKDIYRIFYDGKELCYVKIPLGQEIFCVFEQDPLDIESSGWFRNNAKYEDSISNLMNRHTFLGYLGSYINTAQNENKKINITTKESKFGWGVTNAQIKYGKELNNLVKLGDSPFTHPGEGILVESPCTWFDLSILEKPVVEKESRSSYRPTDNKDIFQIFYDEQNFGFIYIPPDNGNNKTVFTLYSQCRQNDTITEGCGKYLRDPVTGIEIIEQNKEFILENLGAFFEMSKKNNTLLLITADDGSSPRWERHHKIQFAKERKDLTVLRATYMRHPVYNKVWHYTAWINYNDIE